MQSNEKLGELQMPDGNGDFPTEPKVKAARLAAGVATFLVGLLVRQLTPLGQVEDVLVEILTDAIIGLVAFGAAWWAGWKARHVQRQLPPRDPTFD